MERSKKVKRKLEGKKSLSRDGEFHSKTMKNRAMQDNGITGTITDINLNSNFVYLGDKKTISMSSNVFCSQTFESRNEAHEVVKNSGDRILKATYCIRYEPEINVEIEFDSGEKGYISFSRISDRGIRGFEFIEKLFNLYSGSFANVNNLDIKVNYKPTSDTGGKFTLISNNSKVTVQRRFFNTELESNKDYTAIDSWINYLVNYEDDIGWTETTIEDVYTDENEVSILVQTPSNETVFNVPYSQNKNSKFWNLIEDVGYGDPMNLKGESVYIAPYYKEHYHDFDYLVRDIEREWVLSTSIQADEKSTPSYLTKIKNKFNL